MQYTIIASGGKQYKVSVGDIIEVDRLKAAVNSDVVFDNVLLHKIDSETLVGTPNLSGVVVKGKVLENGKGVKLYVSKFKAKSRHRRRIGFRSHLSTVQIIQIDKEQLSLKPIKVEEKVEKPKKSKKKTE